jgi:hypothetical protein
MSYHIFGKYTYLQSSLIHIPYEPKGYNLLASRRNVALSEAVVNIMSFDREVVDGRWAKIKWPCNRDIPSGVLT